VRALISGQAGIAVLIDGEEYSSMEVHSLESVPRAARDVAYLVGDASDLVELDGVSRDDTARELDLAWRKDRSLHLALIAIDGEAARENRLSSAKCLKDLLRDSPITDFVRNRFYAAPLPATADLPGALELAGSSGSAEFANVLRQVSADQELIRRNRVAWDALRSDLFGGAAEKERFGFAAVESGMFRLLARGNSSDALSVFISFTRDHRVDVRRDVRRLVKRWQKISELAAKDSLAPDSMRARRYGGEPARWPKRFLDFFRSVQSIGAPVWRHRLWALAASLLVVALIAFATFLAPVSAKNATALTPPGTGGIKATSSLFRSEVRFTGQGTKARRYFDQAENALSEGDFSKAARWYEMSREAVDTLAAQLNFGIAVYNTSDLPKAASIFSSGLKTARERHIEVLESGFLTNLGNVYREQGLLEQAGRLYTDAYKIDSRIGNPLGLATNEYNLGLLLGIRGKFLESLFSFDIARTAYQQGGNKSGEADALVGRASSYRSLQNAHFWADLRAAAALYAQMPGALAEANYHSVVGETEFFQGYGHPSNKASLGRALEEYKRAYAIYERIGYMQGQMAALCSLGNVYSEQSDPAEAKAFYMSCLDIAKKTGSPFREAIALESVGDQDVFLGKYGDALVNLKRAADLANKIGAKAVEVEALHGIGYANAKSGDEEQALFYFEKAVKTAEENGDRYVLISALQRTADDFMHLRDVGGARGALIRLRDLYAAVGDDKKSAEVRSKIEQLPK
jgi:tetratricopeptide (TPR) repeat protein